MNGSFGFSCPAAVEGAAVRDLSGDLPAAAAEQQDADAGVHAGAAAAGTARSGSQSLADQLAQQDKMIGELLPQQQEQDMQLAQLGLKQQAEHQGKQQQQPQAQVLKQQEVHLQQQQQQPEQEPEHHQAVASAAASPQQSAGLQHPPNVLFSPGGSVKAAMGRQGGVLHLTAVPNKLCMVTVPRPSSYTHNAHIHTHVTSLELRMMFSIVLHGAARFYTGL